MAVWFANEVLEGRGEQHVASPERVAGATQWQPVTSNWMDVAERSPCEARGEGVPLASRLAQRKEKARDLFKSRAGHIFEVLLPRETCLDERRLARFQLTRGPSRLLASRLSRPATRSVTRRQARREQKRRAARSTDRGRDPV